MNYILTLLQEMTVDQKKALVEILGLKKNEDQEIVTKISKLLLPAKGWLQEPQTYEEFIRNIAEKNKETLDFSKGVVTAEKELYVKLFQKEFESLSQDEKDKIFEEFAKAGLTKNQFTSLTGMGAIGAAQLSGFGVYLLASSTVGAITSLLGITLPFAVYTGMSSAISFIIGPVGFLVMGVMLYRSFKHIKSWKEAEDILLASWKEIGTLVQGDFERGTQLFKYLAASRIILENNFTTEIKTNSEKIEILTADIFLLDNNHSNIEEEISTINDNVDLEHYKINELEVQILQMRENISDIQLQIDNHQFQIEKKRKEKGQIVKSKEGISNQIENIEKISSILSQKIKKIG